MGRQLTQHGSGWLHFLRYIAAAIAAVIFVQAVAAEQTDQNHQEPRTIRYVGSQYYPPLESRDEQGQAVGYISDLARAMAASSGDQVEFDLIPWHEALAAVQNGDADMIALIASEARREFYDFTTPFYYVAHSIFSHRRGPQFGALEQLAGHRVAFVRGSFSFAQVSESEQPFEIVTAEHELECLEMVANRTADACIEVSITSNHLAQMYRLPVEVTSPPFWPQPYVFAVKKGNTELLDLLNIQLATIVVDGSYQAVYRKWAAEIEWKPHSIWQAIQHALWIFLVILGLAVTFFLWSWTLRKQVRKRTADLFAELKRSRQLQNDLRYASTHDSATGLLNRSAFFENLDKSLSQPQKTSNNTLTLLVIQVTNVDRIAITLGYQATLETVNNVARRLQRFPDTTNAHYGSGLFAMLYRGDLPINDVVTIVAQAQLSDGTRIEPQLAFGVAGCSTDNKHQSNVCNAAELVRRGMTALAYARKKKTTVAYYSSEIEPNSLNLRLLNDFQRVHCSQFVLHYQPQLDLHDNEITHIEALIRWQHPDFGLLPPVKFIALFEETGAINVITRWVIRECIAMLKHHHESLKVSLNITTRDLVDDDFVPLVKELIQGINPERLVFEVTETGIFTDSQQAQRSMKELHQLGIQFAVDDFGTGYSSLSYLNELAIQEIKIDRSFVAELTQQSRALAIVQSTIALAKELGLDVVAEGVEDRETLELLRKLGTDRIQGYYLAKPMPETELDLKKIVRSD
ncbi:putative bifunctional diguanylate cyclase/phosphodiesterase [Aliidiomarina haloalkalitolerans]|uniref:putative bifunctional diguanylate cyclase/phosphodiesterase n=1 Tax=Aliidiomarina haloalkalitolerans TaxID=859059 RepID=UPI0018E5394D|nr:EAL domain-containing protein [Aliidiomarina haloalkalitolerans]